MRWGWIAGAIMFTSAVFAPGLSPATAATTCPATTTTLCATTTVTGSTTGAVVAALAKPAKLSADGVSVTGGGRVIGIGLTPYPVAPDGPIILSVQPGSAYGNGRYFTNPGFSTDSDGNTVLPAGRYRVYLIADGKAVTGTLRFHGLTGRSQLTTTAIAGTAIREVPLRPDAVAPNTVEGAVDHTMARSGYAGMFTKAVTDDPSLAGVGVCVWDGKAPAEAQTQPGCPGTRSLPAVAYEGSSVSYLARYDAGPRAMGGYVAAPQRIVSAREIAFWFEIR